MRAVSVWWAVLTCFWLGFQVVAAGSCESRVSIGDQNVGISALEDASCKIGGLGCFPDGTCRFCQKVSSPQSNHLIKCSSIATTATQTPVPTTVQTTTAPPATAAPTIDCSSIVKKSTLKGISFVTDNACNVARPTAIGCTAYTSCRLCRTTKNEANQFLVNCAAYTKPNAASIHAIALSGATTGIVEVGPGSLNYTQISIACLSVMALVVAIIGLAHSRMCRRDNTDASGEVVQIGFANEVSYSASVEKFRV